jgi:cell division transport system ATP-binding protein
MSTHNVHLLQQFPGIVYRCKEGVISNVTDEFHDAELLKELESEAQDENTTATENTTENEQ